MPPFRADGDLERLLNPFCEKARCNGGSWGMRKLNPISPWRIRRDGGLKL